MKGVAAGRTAALSPENTRPIALPPPACQKSELHSQRSGGEKTDCRVMVGQRLSLCAARKCALESCYKNKRLPGGGWVRLQSQIPRCAVAGQHCGGAVCRGGGTGHNNNKPCSACSVHARATK